MSLLTTISSIVVACGTMPIASRPNWDREPDIGVHIAGIGKCVGGCEISRYDVILAVDGALADGPSDVYGPLSDGKSHSVRIWDYRSLEEKLVKIRIRHNHLPSFGFVAVGALKSVLEPGRGRLLGSAVAHSRFYGATGDWIMPDSQFGQTYMIFDFTSFTSDEWLDRAAVAILRNAPPVPVFLLQITSDPKHVSGGERLSELNTLPNVVFASTSSGTGYRHLQGYDMSPPSPNLSVVDCHGVIRWHSNYAVSFTSEFDIVISDAIEAARGLELERQQGGCWSTKVPSTSQ